MSYSPKSPDTTKKMMKWLINETMKVSNGESTTSTILMKKVDQSLAEAEKHGNSIATLDRKIAKPATPTLHPREWPESKGFFYLGADRTGNECVKYKTLYGERVFRTRDNKSVGELNGMSLLKKSMLFLGV